MELYAKDKSQQWHNWGSRVYNNKFLHDDYYDITLLCSDDYLITFLQPLKARYSMAFAYYEDKKLTKREMIVIRYLIKKFTIRVKYLNTFPTIEYLPWEPEYPSSSLGRYEHQGEFPGFA
jgi:hypothetical protein